MTFHIAKNKIMIRFKKCVNTRQKVYRLSMMNFANSTRIFAITWRNSKMNMRRWFMTTLKWNNPTHNRKDHNKFRANL
jgi:hypothetical protein